MTAGSSTMNNLCHASLLSFALIIASGSVAIRSLAATEVTVDKSTLFLAHFDTNLDADIARGSAERVRGHGALTRNHGGKVGEGLICRNGMVTNPIGISGPFWPLAFPLDGNLDLKEGTLEFWYKPSLSKKVDADNTQSLYYLFDIPTSLKDSIQRICRFALVLRECFKKETGTATQIFHCFFRENQEIQTVVAWKADEWHHIAVTWNRDQGVLFLDGKRIEARPTPCGLYGGDRALFLGDFYVGGILCLPDTIAADGIIDELRISKTVRYSESFIP